MPPHTQNPVTRHSSPPPRTDPSSPTQALAPPLLHFSTLQIPQHPFPATTRDSKIISPLHSSPIVSHKQKSLTQPNIPSNRTLVTNASSRPTTIPPSHIPISTTPPLVTTKDLCPVLPLHLLPILPHQHKQNHSPNPTSYRIELSSPRQALILPISHPPTFQSPQHPPSVTTRDLGPAFPLHLSPKLPHRQNRPSNPTPYLSTTRAVALGAMPSPAPTEDKPIQPPNTKTSTPTMALKDTPISTMATQDEATSDDSTTTMSTSTNNICTTTTNNKTSNNHVDTKGNEDVVMMESNEHHKSEQPEPTRQNKINTSESSVSALTEYGNSNDSHAASAPGKPSDAPLTALPHSSSLAQAASTGNQPSTYANLPPALLDTIHQQQLMLNLLMSKMCTPADMEKMGIIPPKEIQITHASNHQKQPPAPPPNRDTILPSANVPPLFVTPHANKADHQQRATSWKPNTANRYAALSEDETLPHFNQAQRANRTPPSIA